MKINHPFAFVADAARRATFIVAALLALGCMAVFQFVLDPPLRTTVAPMGIVSLELAGSVETVRAILGSWGSVSDRYVAFGLGFDFLFMALYGLALGLGTAMATGRLEERFAALGKTLGWGVLVAVLADAAENVILFRIIAHGNVEPLPLLAAVFAVVKFALIVMAILYSLLGLFFPRREEKPAEPKAAA